MISYDTSGELSVDLTVSVVSGAPTAPMRVYYRGEDITEHCTWSADGQTCTYSCPARIWSWPTGTESFPADSPPPIPQPKPSCRACGTLDLDTFYTSARDGTTLCPACFAEREEAHLAVHRSVQNTSKKTTHPFDRW